MVRKKGLCPRSGYKSDVVRHPDGSWGRREDIEAEKSKGPNYRKGVTDDRIKIRKGEITGDRIRVTDER